MAEFLEEKRCFPRIKANLRVGLSKNLSGNSIDLSEGGLSFNCWETISSPKISLQISFPDKSFELKTKAKLIWRRDLKEGQSLYGVEFQGLSKTQKETLRKELIKIHISKLLDKIEVPEIKDKVSHFFLEELLGYLNEIIRISQGLPKEYSPELKKKLDQLNTKILLKGYCLEELFSKERIIESVKDNFRQLLGVWLYKSLILKWAWDKPRGYPGDYKMLEIIYDNKPISENIGLYFDNVFLKSPYAVAIRLRKDHLSKLLVKFINETEKEKINILNITCGSSREIRELLPYLKTKSFITFTCLDGDEEALKFSQESLSPSSLKNVEFKFAKENVLGMIKDENCFKPYSGQDLIYSIGLVDYLPDRVLKELIKLLYLNLSGGGRLILTCKNRDKTIPPIYPDWLCDWKFVPRNKEEVSRLIYSSPISKFSLSIESDEFEYIFYFILTKLSQGG